MTVDFCYEIQIIISRTTVDTVPKDFKFDDFILRGAMRIFNFSHRLLRSICSDFFLIDLKKFMHKHSGDE